MPYCPNCSAEIVLETSSCRNCKAQFGEAAIWRPTEQPTGVLRKFSNTAKASGSAGRPRSRVLYVAAVVIATMLTCVVAGSALFRSWVHSEARKVLPMSLEISEVMVAESIPSAAEQLLSLDIFNRQSCGAAIFVLSDRTWTHIENNSVGYLQNATRPRGDDSGWARGREYAAWQMSPLPEKWIDNRAEAGGLWYGLPCVTLDKSFASELRTAAKSSGSYYTYDRSASLVLIPRLKVAIYSWWNI
jgi:hypothetical protein